MHSGKALAIFAIRISVAIGIETIGNSIAFIARAIFIEIVPIQINLVFIKQLIAIVQCDTTAKEIILAIYISPAASIVIITRAIIIPVADQSFYPNTRKKFAPLKFECNFANFCAAFCTCKCLSIKVMPRIVNLLPTV